jgi:hypothetical protein
MSIRNRLATLAAVMATLAIAAPVAGASAATGTSGNANLSTPVIPCYPYPAFCGPNGQPWWSFPFPLPITLPPILHIGGPGPVQLPPTLRAQG